jgi:NAD(P)-dependent dehydrogenase (short-subunit alcohol dehydrogenase family)
MDKAFFSLGGKVAVVTGASREIGGAVAAALVHAGAAVALLGRNAQALADSHAALVTQGRTVMHMTVDVGVTSSINAAFEQILQSMLPDLDAYSSFPTRP